MGGLLDRVPLHVDLLAFLAEAPVIAQLDKNVGPLVVRDACHFLDVTLHIPTTTAGVSEDEVDRMVEAGLGLGLVPVLDRLLVGCRILGGRHAVNGSLGRGLSDVPLEPREKRLEKADRSAPAHQTHFQGDLSLGHHRR